MVKEITKQDELRWLLTSGMYMSPNDNKGGLFVLHKKDFCGKHSAGVE